MEQSWEDLVHKPRTWGAGWSPSQLQWETGGGKAPEDRLPDCYRASSGTSGQRRRSRSGLGQSLAWRRKLRWETDLPQPWPAAGTVLPPRFTGVETEAVFVVGCCFFLLGRSVCGSKVVLTAHSSHRGQLDQLASVPTPDQQQVLSGFGEKAGVQALALLIDLFQRPSSLFQ